jgi:predicted NUDIX family NTP pyrophosphohydrolase
MELFDNRTHFNVVHKQSQYGVKHSAGIVVYRVNDQLQTEYLLVHPGGPWYWTKEYACWDIPKGEISDGEIRYECALREFQEETGHPLPKQYKQERMAVPLGTVTLGSGKIVHAWAACADLDTSKMVSNNFEMEWPKNSGKMESFPEADRFVYFSFEEAKRRIHIKKIPFLEKVQSMVAEWYSKIGV